MQSDRSSTVQSDRRRFSHYVPRLLLHGMARFPSGARATNLPLGARRDRDSHIMRGNWLLLLAQVYLARKSLILKSEKQKIAVFILI